MWENQPTPIEDEEFVKSRAERRRKPEPEGKRYQYSAAYKAANKPNAHTGIKQITKKAAKMTDQQLGYFYGFITKARHEHTGDQKQYDKIQQICNITISEMEKREWTAETINKLAYHEQPTTGTGAPRDGAAISQESTGNS